MSNYKILNASFSLSVKDLKDKQELAHHPMDFNSTTVDQFNVLSEKSGYTGPQYDLSSMPDNIMVASGQSNVGMSLPVNQSIGAPAMTFVYGAYPKNSLVQHSELMKVKIGPERSLYDEEALRNLENPELLNGTPIQSSFAGLDYLPGVITGTTGDSNSEQYIPTGITNLPFNIAKTDYKDRIYDSYNVWDISGRLNPFSTEKYVYALGRSTPNHYLNPGHIFQQSSPASLRVIFASYATELELFKRPGTYGDATELELFKRPGTYGDEKGSSYVRSINRVNPVGRWMFMGDYRQAKYLLGDASVPKPDDKATDTLKSKVGLFEIYSGEECDAFKRSGGEMAGFVLNIDLDSAADNVAFSGGSFPEVKVLIGGAMTVDDSGGIQGAQVILSLGKPPQVVFPVRGSEGSRYFKTPRGGSNASSTSRAPTGTFADLSSGQDVRLQIVTAKEPLSATSGTKVTVQFEALGDLGIIRVVKDGLSLISAHIAPQVGVAVESAGFQETQPDYYTNCYCRIKGTVRILASNIQGKFDISPICYRSWSPSMLMFMHVPFAVSSSRVLEDMVGRSRYSDMRSLPETTGGTRIVLPYSYPKYSYFFNDSVTRYLAKSTGNDEDILKGGGILGSNTRYPDAIADPRGAVTAAYSVQRIDNAGFAANWEGPYNITAKEPLPDPRPSIQYTINQGPSRKGKLDGLESAGIVAEGGDPLKGYGHNQLTARELYTQPQYGGLTPFYIKYSVPCIAMWCHPYQNTQLNFAWPSIDQVEWIDEAKTLTGSAWYSRAGTKFQTNATESITSRDIESVNVRTSLDGVILKKDTKVVIRNPNRDMLSMLETQGVASGSKGYGTLNIYSNSKWTKLDGFIRDYQLNEVGTGLVLTITFQDPLSYLIERLPYPGEHIVDGWQVPHAVQYILLRLGLPIDASVTNVGRAVTVTTYDKAKELVYANGPKKVKIPRLGRFVATDIGTNSIKFSAGDGALRSNLLTALGMVPAFQYPVFFWSKEGVIKYRDAFDNSSQNVKLSFDSWRDQGIPIIRDTMNISFDASATTYQTVLHTKDRFRSTDIHVPVGLGSSGAYSGYKSQKTINLEGFITEKQDLQLLREQMEYQNVFISDSSISFQYAGPPLYTDEGGAGVVRSILVPYLPYQRRSYLLQSSTYDIEFGTGNYGKTDLQWQLLKPPIMKISGTLFGR